MKTNLRFLLVGMLMMISTVSFGKDCEICGPDKVQGMPANKEFGMMGKIVEKVGNQAEDDLSASEYLSAFCMKFQQTSKGLLGKVMDDMKKTSYTVDEYFKMPECQSGGYSESVKSPLLHYVADAPSKRADFLEVIFLYFTKTLKHDPAAFTEALNSKNTKGETFLDYLETLKMKGANASAGQQEALAQIISFACSKNGQYNIYSKNRKCSTP